MMNNHIYKVVKYSDNLKNIFKGVYNDFLSKAYIEYRFEIEPLLYDDFITSVDNKLIDCLILLEDEIPTGFMVYTTEISEAIELNLIHCLGDENLNHKRKLLMDKFMEENAVLLKEKVVTYPMLGTQNDFTPEIVNYGFNLTGLAVLRFKFENAKSANLFKSYIPPVMPNDYKVVNWATKYEDEVPLLIQKAFKDSVDARFDPRFNSIEGCRDILNKITTNIYGRFMPDACSLLLYKDKPVGFCLANITAGTIANIPLIGIIKEHCGKGFGKALLYNSVKSAINNYLSHLSEINASTETDNYAALKMYRSIGFKEDYNYTQAYRPFK